MKKKEFIDLATNLIEKVFEEEFNSEEVCELKASIESNILKVEFSMYYHRDTIIEGNIVKLNLKEKSVECFLSEPFEGCGIEELIEEYFFRLDFKDLSKINFSNYKFKIESYKSSDGYADMMHTLGLQDELYETFEHGEFGSFELEIDKNILI
jgi:hypothetical protein